MHTLHLVTGARRSFLFDLFGRERAKSVTTHDSNDSDLSIDACGLTERHESLGAPDVSLRKMSLTRNEAIRPKSHMCSFGYDFEPFM